MEFSSSILEKYSDYPGIDGLPLYAEPPYSPVSSPERAKDYPFVLCTGARLPMFIHSRLFRLPWVRSLRPDAAADLNPADAGRLGIAQGDEIELATPTGSIRVRANLSQMIRPGDVHMYHGYPDADVNRLLEGDYLDPISGFPGYKAALCAVRKAPTETADPGGTEMTYALRLDLDRCVGCMACAVACMDQNDLEIGAEPTAWRQVFTVESGAYPEARLRYVSMACMHCEDAPCRMACPTGAISRDAATRAVRIDARTVHRLPQLFDSLSVRGAPLRPGRHHAEMRPVQRRVLNRVWSRHAFGCARAKPCIMETRTRLRLTPRRRRPPDSREEASCRCAPTARSDRQPVVSQPDRRGSVLVLEALDDEVRSRQVLEVVDEEVVDRPTRYRAGHRDGESRRLSRDHRAET